MILRRSILAAVPALLLPQSGWARPKFAGGSANPFTPDGTFITYNSGPPFLTSKWGQFSFQTTPLAGGGGICYPMLNGHPVALLQTIFSPPPTGPEYAYGYQLQIDHGGEMYFYVNGDFGWRGFVYYNWALNIAVGPPPANQPIPFGASFPQPTIHPPYPPISTDGTLITFASQPTGTVVTAEGVWSFGGVNAQYSSARDLVLNGVQVGANRAEGDTNASTGLAWLMDTIAMEVNSHGQLFVQRNDSTWRLVRGMYASPSTGPTSSVVPLSIAYVVTGNPGASQTPPYPYVPYTSPAGTQIATVTMTLSDGTTVVPLTSELSDGGGILTFGSGGTVLTGSNTHTQGQPEQYTIIATRNGTSAALPFLVYYN